MQRLRRSFADSTYWGPEGTPQARGWADAIVTCFQRYAELADRDGRVAFALDLKYDVGIGAHIVGVHVDAVLLDDEGYIGRIVLWDLAPLSIDLAVEYSVPVLLALEEQLGEDRVAGVQVWHLRTGATQFVSADACGVALPRVTRRVADMVR